MVWINADGLRVLFDNEEAALGAGGKVSTMAPEQMVEWYIDYTMFTTSTDTASPIVDWNTYVPDNSRLSRLEVVATTLWNSAGNGFTMNLGLVRATDHSTVIDYDGLLAVLPEASLDPAGERFEADYINHNTYGGDLLGTTITQPGVLSLYYGTEAPTGGAGYVRLYYTPNVWTGAIAAQ